MVFGFLTQRQDSPVELFNKRKKEIQVKLGRFDSSFLVQNVFEVEGKGTALAGRVLRGTLKAGQRAYFDGFWGKVETIECFDKPLLEAEEGKSVAVTVSGFERPVPRGAMLHLK